MKVLKEAEREEKVTLAALTGKAKRARVRRRYLILKLNIFIMGWVY